MDKKKYGSKEQIQEGKIFAVLAYLSIFCIIPLLFKKDNPFALAHGKQGLVIFIAEVGTLIIHILMGPWLLRWGLFICGVYSLIGIVSSLKGEFVRLWIVSDIANKISL